METGDTDPVIAAQDLAAHETNGTAYSPGIATAINNENLPAGLIDAIDRQLAAQPAGAGAGAYRAYDNWSLANALRIVSYMSSSCPDQRYLLR